MQMTKKSGIKRRRDDPRSLFYRWDRRDSLLLVVCVVVGVANAVLLVLVAL